MPNTNSPFGFEHVGFAGGRPGTYGNTTRSIASTNTDVIFTGDPVYSLATGYIAKATPGTTPICGIFVGCRYYSPAAKTIVWSPYYPGSGASGDVECYIITDESALFKVQVGGSTTTGVVFADIGANIQFAYGTGNTGTGLSGAFVDQTTIATTSTLPFRIVDIITSPAGVNGYDATGAYNVVLVRVNNQDFNQLTGV